MKFKFDDEDIAVLREHAAELKTVKRLLVNTNKHTRLSVYLNEAIDAFEDWASHQKIGPFDLDDEKPFELIWAAALDEDGDNEDADMRFLLRGFKHIINETENYLYAVRCNSKEVAEHRC